MAVGTVALETVAVGTVGFEMPVVETATVAIVDIEHVAVALRGYPGRSDEVGQCSQVHCPRPCRTCQLVIAQQAIQGLHLLHRRPPTSEEHLPVCWTSTCQALGASSSDGSR